MPAPQDDSRRADATTPLHGIRVVSLAPNLPGPAAAARLVELGADVTKVEPPAGDLLEHAVPEYYAQLAAGQKVLRLDLKAEDGIAAVWELLADADLLITSSRPSALRKLGLGWDEVHARLPMLNQIAIVGYPGDRAEHAGHDLTYQAMGGLVDGDRLPRTLVADLAGAERAATEAVALLLQRARTGEAGYREVALSDGAEAFAAPAKYGMTGEQGFLGGVLPQYGVYPASDGLVAIAALEAHFWQRFVDLTGAQESHASVAKVLATRTAHEWESWGVEHDVPLAEVR